MAGIGVSPKRAFIIGIIALGFVTLAWRYQAVGRYVFPTNG